MPPNTVKVTRPSAWGNDYVVWRDDEGHWTVSNGGATWLEPLRGKNIACWCKLGEPCHADVLLRLANSELPNAEVTGA